MQWLRFFLVFIGVASLLLRQKKLGEEKGQSPSEGGVGVGQNFYGCQDFLLLSLNVKNLTIFGRIWICRILCVSLQ